MLDSELSVTFSALLAYVFMARLLCLQCFDAVGWAVGRASGP